MYMYRYLLIYLSFINEPTKPTKWGTSAGGLDGSVRPVSCGAGPQRGFETSYGSRMILHTEINK